MSNYVDDNLDLANHPKADGAGDATGVWDASDANAVRSALNDLKNAFRSLVRATLTNSTGGTIPPGTPVYASAAGVLSKSKADASATADVDCLAFDSIANATSGQGQSVGFMTLTTAQWDAVTGQTGGLTANAHYYLDPATAGKITTTVPTTVGQFLVHIGRAISTTQMRLLIQPPIGL